MAKGILGKTQNIFTKSSPSSDELRTKIQKKAYELWEKSGKKPGNDLAHWLEAERLVRSGRC